MPTSMHFVRIVGLVAVVLLSVQAANAQIPSPRASITLSVPAGPTDIALGGNASVDVQVSITIANVVCQGPGTATVNLALKDVPSAMNGITGTLPTSIVFPMEGPKAYTDAGNGAFTGGPVTKKLNVTVAANTIANHEHTFNITATFAESGLQGCTKSPAPGSTLDATANAQTAIKTGPATGGNGGSGTGTGGINGTATTTSNAAFSLPVALQVSGLLAIAMVASRRKQE